MRKKDVLKSVGRRILAMALSAALGLSLIGCGSEGEQETPKKEWAYVPEFLTLDAEEVSFWDMKAVGDYLYYSSYTYDEETGAGDRNICRYSLVDRQMTTVSLAWPEDVLGGKGINDFMIGGDGSVYITNSEYNMETGSSSTYINSIRTASMSMESSRRIPRAATSSGCRRWRRTIRGGCTCTAAEACFCMTEKEKAREPFLWAQMIPISKK